MSVIDLFFTQIMIEYCSGPCSKPNKEKEGKQMAKKELKENKCLRDFIFSYQFFFQTNFTIIQRKTRSCPQINESLEN